MIEDIEVTETEWQAVVNTAEKVRLLQLEPDLKENRWKLILHKALPLAKNLRTCVRVSLK